MVKSTWLATTIAALAICSSSANAKLEWQSGDYEDGNPQHTYSLPMTTNPNNYHVTWEKLIRTSHEKFKYLSTIIVADSKIITAGWVNTDDHGSFNFIETRNTNTGDLIWSKVFQDNEPQELTYHSGKIFTLVSDESKKNTQSLISYDANSGEMTNTTSISDSIWHPTSYGDSIYFATGRHGLGSLNPNNYQINWSQPLDPGKLFESSLTINSPYILTRDHNGILIYDIKNGKETKKIWLSDIFRDDHGAAPIIDGDMAYSIFSNNSMWEGRIYAFDLKNGKVKWTMPKQYNEYATVIARSMILTNHTLISLNDRKDRINFIDADNGKLMWIWYVPRGEEINGPYSMVATNDVLFIACAKHIYAISLTTHKIVWQMEKYAYRLFLSTDRLFIVYENEAKESYLTAVALN